jgi:hypothetical protein
MVPHASTLAISDFPTLECYRLNVIAAAVQAGLDVARLEIYRRAVQAGFFTDELPGCR